MTLIGRLALAALALLPGVARAQTASSGAVPADPPAHPTNAPPVFSDEERRKIVQHSPLPPPPADSTNRVADDPAAAALGQALFFDERLSPRGDLSCATCHDPQKGFADGKPLAEGAATGTRNALSLWNVAYNRWYFWDGRADTLWAQATQPIENELELKGSRLHTAELIRADDEYRRRYESLFGPIPALAPGDPAAVDLVFVNAAKAIAAYERKLVSRRSPFDVFAEGLAENETEKLSALSPAAQRGLKLFVGSANCRLCHSGPNFTDGEFHTVRVPPRAGGRPDDPGRHRGAELVRADPFNARGVFSDDRAGPAAEKIEFLANTAENWGRFKTPSLRNVALTAPYMHQGQFETIRDVLEYYSTLEEALPPGHHETETILEPLMLSDRQIADLAAFLESLTDEAIDASLLRDPRAARPADVPDSRVGQPAPETR